VQAVFETTLGNITCTLFPDKTPVTVDNFIGLATGKKDWKNPASGATMHNKPLYDGTIFHRVIPNFMIQGGDPTGTGRGGPGYAIKDEFTDHNRNDRGTVAMANAGPNTGGSQFFINLVNNNYLDKAHPVFGKVIEGMDVVKKMGKVKTGAMDRPAKEVKIVGAKIVD